MRIPDIYENNNNKRIFGQFLESCYNAKNEEQVIKEIIALDEHKIKGLGPAVANILYFLHPEWIPPFNTAIVRGFNMLFKENIKLGSWTEYLRMRELIITVNSKHNKLSKDLGAFSGLLFDIGEYQIILPENIVVLSDKEREQAIKKQSKRHQDRIEDIKDGDTHTEMQYHLLKIGKELGYDVMSASNDVSRCYKGIKFSSLNLLSFPDLGLDSVHTEKTIKLIDVLWFEKGTNKIVSAFEVEKSTTINSGALRLFDLYKSFPKAPSLLFSELRKECESVCKFGEDVKILHKIAKTV